jgi:hypothetical protein
MKDGRARLQDHGGVEEWFRPVVSNCSQKEIGAVAKNSDFGKKVYGAEIAPTYLHSRGALRGDDYRKK